MYESDVRGGKGPSRSLSLARAEGSMGCPPGGNLPLCPLSSTISLSSTITGRTAHCCTHIRRMLVYISDRETTDREEKVGVYVLGMLPICFWTVSKASSKLNL